MTTDNSYLWELKLERNETLHIMCNVWFLSSFNAHSTYMYNMASYCSVCNVEVTDDGEALECDEC